MIVTPRHFVRFIDGRASDRMVVAFLPGSLGRYLGTLQTDVSLRRDYALKLIKHNIDYNGFSEIQNTIDNGHCLREKPNHLAFLFVKDNIKPEIYFLLIKTDKTREELWLVTFHRIKKSQFTKRLVPSNIIRPHVEEFME